MDFPGYECFSNAILSWHFSLKAGPKRPESHNFDNFLDFLHRYQKGILYRKFSYRNSQVFSVTGVDFPFKA